MNAYSFIFSDVIEHDIKFKEVDNGTVPGSKIFDRSCLNIVCLSRSKLRPRAQTILEQDRSKFCSPGVRQTSIIIFLPDSSVKIPSLTAPWRAEMNHVEGTLKTQIIYELYFFVLSLSPKISWQPVRWIRNTVFPFESWHLFPDRSDPYK